METHSFGFRLLANAPEGQKRFPISDVPVAPCVVGLILGPLAEQQFRRALTIRQGDATIFFTHPISDAILLIALLLVIVPVIMRRWAAKAVRPG